MVRVMPEPQSTQPHPYANIANDLSTSFAFAFPRNADDVGSFLFDAAYAIGDREVVLARHLGVSRATFSGWKKRGSIPAPHLTWFATRFSIEVLQGNNPPQHEGFKHVGLEVALGLFEATDFNPFNLANGATDERVRICFKYLGGISRLALFVLRRSEVEFMQNPLSYRDLVWAHVLPRLGSLVALSGPAMLD